MLQDIVIANKTYAKLSIPTMENLDEIAIRVIKQDTPDFLMQMKMMNIDGEIELRYEIGSDLRFSYLPMEMTKNDFLLLLQSLLRPFKECNDWFLDYHHFYLDMNYITVSKDYTSIRYIYIPDMKFHQNEETILNFFRNFILNMNLTDAKSYILELYRILNASGTSLGMLIDQIENDVIQKESETIKRTSQVSQMTSEKKSDFEVRKEWKSQEVEKAAEFVTEKLESVKESISKKGEEFGADNIQNDLIGNLFGDVDEEEETKGKKKDKKKDKRVKKEKEVKSTSKEKGGKGFLGGLFSGGKGKEEKREVKEEQEVRPKQQEREVVYFDKVSESYDETYYDNADEEYDNTVLGGDDELQSNENKFILELLEDGGYHFPKYIEIDLRKGYAMVGRYDKNGKAQADYNFDASLSFISRKHFRIEKKGNGYVIIDVGSGNGTFVNDNLLAVNMAYSINVGDRIVLSKKHRITYKVC